MKKINTGLVGQAAFVVMNDVMGQLSDGLWENSSCMEKYWKNSKIEIDDGEIFINVGDSFNCPFNDMADKEVKAWFAKKIKQVVKYFEQPWKRDCRNQVDGFSDSLTVADIYRVYDTLLERKAR